MIVDCNGLCLLCLFWCVDARLFVVNYATCYLGCLILGGCSGDCLFYLLFSCDGCDGGQIDLVIVLLFVYLLLVGIGILMFGMISSCEFVLL